MHKYILEIYNQMYWLFEWFTFRTKSDKDSDQGDIEFLDELTDETILLYNNP